MVIQYKNTLQILIKYKYLIIKLIAKKDKNHRSILPSNVLSITTLQTKYAITVF